VPGSSPPVPPRSAGTFPLAAIARDLDGDFVSELLVIDQTADSVGIVRNAGAGNLLVDQRLLSSVRPLSVVSGDFDGDGRYDLLATGLTTAEAINISDFVAPLRGDGNGDGLISIADVTALTRELRDGDSARVDDVTRGTYAGTQGVDADGDGLVTHLDFRLVLARQFPPAE
jgi:hypothetical protein